MDQEQANNQRFFFKGILVDPRVRTSNAHIPIVRVPRAGERPDYPSHPSSTARCAAKSGEGTSGTFHHHRLEAPAKPL